MKRLQSLIPVLFLLGLGCEQNQGNRMPVAGDGDTSIDTNVNSSVNTSINTIADANTHTVVVPPEEPTDSMQTILEGLVPRLDAMAVRTFDWWMLHGRDTVNGGFHGTLDSQGTPVFPTDKGLIQQSRHLWALSMWIERRNGAIEVKQAAQETYQFIINHMRDTDGLFFFKVSQTGTPVNTNKKIYAQAFAIYGLATYGRVLGVSQAVDYALSCFHALDAKYHDPIYGGYDQTNDPDSWIGGVARGTNTHIHLMEAFTALAEAIDDSVLNNRLNELIDITVTHLLQPAGYVHQKFDIAWTPLGSPTVSYGHDLETAWLLLDAARVTGRSDEPAILDASRTMALTSGSEGYDSANGGTYDSGVPGGAVSNNEKVWWAQFETLCGLWVLYALTGDPAIIDKLEKTVDWIESMEDLPNGEWYWGHYADGSLGPRGDKKGEEWKTSYHNLRALVYTADWINAAL